MRVKRTLANGRSSNWALWDKFQVPQYDGDGNYLTRWRLIRTPWFGLYVHRMDGPDPRPTLHDHPWNFLSIILRGGYVERKLDPMTMEIDEAHTVRHFNRFKAYNSHSIRRLLRTPTWTFMVIGREVKEWGYWERVTVQGPKVYVDKEWQGDKEYETAGWRWTPYNKHLHAYEFDAALQRRKEAEMESG